MRLSFPNGEHADVIVARGDAFVGSEHGNDVVISGAGLAGRHACFRVDPQRGIVLTIENPACAAHVNGRPVRRHAFLRLGDVVSLGELQVLVKPDDDAEIETAIPEACSDSDRPNLPPAAARVVLRALSGPLFGRAYTLVAPLVVGRSRGAQVRIDDPAFAEVHARFENHGDCIVLRDLGSAEGSLVNGVPVRDAVLHPGDQIVFDQYHFVLEAPGLPPRGYRDFKPRRRSGPTITGVIPALDVVPTVAPPPALRPMNVGWLIAAAVLIMASLGALLFYAPR